MESVASAITILSSATSAFGWLTGSTTSKKIENLQASVERLDRGLYYGRFQEVFPKLASSQFQSQKPDAQDLRRSAQPLQAAVGQDLIVSTPVVSPERLQKLFSANPEDVLFDIHPLSGQGLPTKHQGDPTLVPVTFTRWGQPFVGFMKVGYARDYLDFEYRPQSHLFVHQVTQASAPQPQVVRPLPSMDRNALWLKVVQIISDQLGQAPSEILHDKHLAEDLGADSLDFVELVMAFEEELGVEIPDDDAVRMVTPGDIFWYLGG